MGHMVSGSPQSAVVPINKTQGLVQRLHTWQFATGRFGSGQGTGVDGRQFQRPLVQVVVVHAGQVVVHGFGHGEHLPGVAGSNFMPAGMSALHHLGHQRLDQLAAGLIGHHGRGARAQQHRESCE